MMDSNKINKQKESYVENTMQEKFNNPNEKNEEVKSEKLRYKNADDLYK